MPKKSRLKKFKELLDPAVRVSEQLIHSIQGKSAGLDNMNNSSYNIIKTEWNVITSEVYDTWFNEQSEDNQETILERVYLLKKLGPNLGRPYADTLKGSKKVSNLKELRTETEHNVFRIAYVFDPERNGILLTGGDKKGKNQKKFYKNLIKEAEQVYAAYLEKKAKEKEKKI